MQCVVYAALEALKAIERKASGDDWELVARLIERAEAMRVLVERKREAD